MRGVVLREFLDMVDRHFGPETTETITRSAGLTPACFSDASAHPHILRLTKALSRRTGVAEKEILTSFGESIFRRLAGMHPEKVAAAKSALEILETVVTTSLDEARALDPKAMFPVFHFVETGPGSCTVECSCGRPVADLAEGLIRGCLHYCRQNAQVQRADFPGPPGHHAKFEIALDVACAA